MSTRLTVATLNTRGLPLRGTRIAERFGAIAAELEAGDIDLVCLQEVYTYHHLAHLRMPPLPQVAYRPSLAGPAGGLVTLSRTRLDGITYTRLPWASRHSPIPFRARLNAIHNGVLSVRPANSRVRVFNIHPAANTDGDWSERNRFRRLQRDQFAALAQAVTADSSPAVVCGDPNLARASTLHEELRRQSGLRDAFDGRCPPTFHAEFLAPGSAAHCIDFILVTDAIGVDDTGLLFTDKRPLASGPSYLSDHIGLLAQLRIPTGLRPSIRPSRLPLAVHLPMTRCAAGDRRGLGRPRIRRAVLSDATSPTPT